MLYINEKRLLPAPFVDINKSVVFSPDGRPISSNFGLNLKGTLLPNRGSPMSYGWHEDDNEPDPESFITDDQKHDALLKKQELLREAFGTPGFKLAYSAFGEDPVICYPQLESLNFEADNWVIKSQYTIGLRVSAFDKYNSEEIEDQFALEASGLNLQSVGDNITARKVDTIFGDYFEISRNVNATSRAMWGSGSILTPSGNEPWENAKTWVENRLLSSGFDNSYFTISAGSGYNFVEEEIVDRVGGSYALNQNYIYSTVPYIESRQISKNSEAQTVPGSGSATETITINGTISGLDTGNDPSGKIIAAIARWDTIKSSIGTIVGANGGPRSSGLNYDYQQGIVTYNATFINRDALDVEFRYTTSITDSSQGVPVARINGTISGITADDSPDVKFALASSGYKDITDTEFKNLTFESLNQYIIIDEALFTDNPINRSVSLNHAEGVISFDLSYGYDLDGNNNFEDSYTIDYNTQNAYGVTFAGTPISARINGTVRGSTASYDPSARFAEAESGWTTVQNSLYTRVTNDLAKIGTTSLTLSPRPKVKSVTVDRVNGLINYSAEFSTEGYVAHTGVATLDISMDEQRQSDIFAVQVIPGRTPGPILQNISTKSEIRRNININMTLNPAAGGNLWDQTSLTTIRGIADGYVASGLQDKGFILGDRGTKFFVSADSDNWNWNAGTYSRQYSIVYPS